MKTVVSQALSMHQAHELLLKLETAGLDVELAQRVIDSRSNNLATEMVGLIETSGYQITKNQERLKEVMGKNFFGVEEAIRHFGINPRKNKRQIAKLHRVPFSKELLGFCKDTHILVAVFPLSIFDIWKIDDGLFDGLLNSRDEPLFKGPKHGENKGIVSWQLVCKTPLEDSASKDWDKQQRLVIGGGETPSSQVMAYTIIGHYMNTGERLFENTYVRTSCKGVFKNHVRVGFFNSKGLTINYGWDDLSESDLGLASVQRP